MPHGDGMVREYEDHYHYHTCYKSYLNDSSMMNDGEGMALSNNDIALLGIDKKILYASMVF